jgi:hypothetical protein
MLSQLLRAPSLAAKQISSGAPCSVFGFSFERFNEATHSTRTIEQSPEMGNGSEAHRSPKMNQRIFVSLFWHFRSIGNPFSANLCSTLILRGLRILHRK